ncbi:unnamed protein product [Moneuplotes crassus]|uniref:Uncharacterized protein n=1 Tax=Euplotes crassus TaxID=5936 RepID=A0AAD1UAS9_EUPCR|nr:unnamed protein product [Moneuplotes crassus]
MNTSLDINTFRRHPQNTLNDSNAKILRFSQQIPIFANIRDIKNRTNDLKRSSMNLASHRIMEIVNPRKSIRKMTNFKRNTSKAKSEVRKYINSGSRYYDKRSKADKFHKKFSKFKGTQNFAVLKNYSNQDQEHRSTRRPIRFGDEEVDSSNASNTGEKTSEKPKRSSLFKKLEKRRTGILLSFDTQKIQDENQEVTSKPSDSTIVSHTTQTNSFARTSRRNILRPSVDSRKNNNNYMARIESYLRANKIRASFKDASLGQMKITDYSSLTTPINPKTTPGMTDADLSYISDIHRIMKTLTKDEQVDGWTKKSRIHRVKRRYGICRKRIFSH